MVSGYFLLLLGALSFLRILKIALCNPHSSDNIIIFGNFNSFFQIVDTKLNLTNNNIYKVFLPLKYDADAYEIEKKWKIELNGSEIWEEYNWVSALELSLTLFTMHIYKE